MKHQEANLSSPSKALSRPLRWVFALSTGLLLRLSWPTLGAPFFIFFAFFPLLFVCFHLISQHRGQRKALLLTYCAMLLWNVSTTYWIWFAAGPASLPAFIINSFLQAIPFWLATHILRLAYKRQHPIGSFRVFLFLVTIAGLSISLEWLHLQWELPWPWLNLGNAFANHVSWVQWYEYTGTFGGSVWVWLANGLLFWALVSFTPAVVVTKHLAKRIIPFIIIVALPILVSILVVPSTRFNSDKLPATDAFEVLVVQPNIDPYAKGVEENFTTQILNLCSLTASAATPNTRLVVWPETSLPGAFDIGDIKMLELPMRRQVMNIFAKFPNLHILTGATTRLIYGPNRTPSATAIQGKNTGVFYDVFNSAVFIHPDSSLEFYHKRKLVPGVEKMPYDHVLGFLKDFAISLDGGTVSYGSDSSFKVFHIQHNGKNISVAPLICYESVFGKLATEFVRNNGLFAIITNDGWWRDTEGHKQHMLYARLRAIECRRSVLRSANTGISTHITPYGTVMESLSWAKKGTLTFKVHPNDYLTFYARNGDFLASFATFLGFFSLSVSIFILRKSK